MQVDFIIVGQGLAGTLLAHQLMQLKQKILVIDNANPNSASMVAAGMFTPVSGKRMATSWLINELYPTAIQAYTQLQELLQITLLHHKNIHLSFSSIKEQNDFYAAQQNISQYVGADVPPHTGINTPFGVTEITQSGWVNTAKLLTTFKHLLQTNQSYLEQEFNYKALHFKNNNWHYNNITAKGVVFCQGHQNASNPYFSHIPIIDNKGDVFTITTDVLDNTKIFKRGAYVVCINNNLYKLGSTYHWNESDATPTQSGFNELKQKADALINGNYNIVSHMAAIRPTTKDRRPILGKHPQYTQLFMFNGLGTKGVLIGPHFSKIMADYMLHQTPLPDAINLNRFL